jgi:hypothetical protein
LVPVVRAVMVAAAESVDKVVTAVMVASSSGPVARAVTAGWRRLAETGEPVETVATPARCRSGVTAAQAAAAGRLAADSPVRVAGRRVPLELTVLRAATAATAATAVPAVGFSV